jgi:FkbM family methyltransferase
MLGIRTYRRRLQRRRFYRAFVRSGDLVFDVGANLGNRTTVFLTCGARVVAFEPQPLCVAALEARFGSDPSFHLVPMALGRESGSATIYVSYEHTLSTLSADWLSAVSESGRFGDTRWDSEEEVEVTTLDAAIAEFGEPAFVKIDVEGYESEVLSGLSRRLKAGSIEFAAESLDATSCCLDKLESLGNYGYQFALGERPRLELPGWVRAEELKSALRAARTGDPLAWGDVYFVDAPRNSSWFRRIPHARHRAASSSNS